MKHQIFFIRRCRALPRLLLQAFLLGVLFTGSLAVTAGFRLPTAAAQSLNAQRSQGLHNRAISNWSKPEHGNEKPNLFISNSHLGGDHFRVSDDVTFIIVVGNNTHAGSTSSTITVSDLVPTGMRNLRASGDNWDISVSHTKSPATITASYLGHDPVDGGKTLPAIKISGELTEDAIPHLTNTATVNTECNCKMSNNIATDTIFVEKKGHNQECNECKEGKDCKGEKCKNKETDDERRNKSEENINNKTTNSTSSALAVSAVASANVNNMFGGVGGVPGFGGAGGVPGLPDTGSDPGSRALL